MTPAMRNLLAAALLLSAGAATAQTSALKSHDTEAPIDVDAERIEVRDRENQAVFSGDVKIKQASLNLDAATVKVFYSRAKGSSSPVIRRLDAQGGVKLTSPSETATSRYGIYDVTAKTITMVGNVVLTRGDSVLRGQRLAIDLESGRSTLDAAGGQASATKPGETPVPGGRVSGRFVVPPREAK